MSDDEEPPTKNVIGEADGGKDRRPAGERLGNLVGRGLYKGAKAAVQLAARGTRDVLKRSYAIDNAVGKGLAHIAAGMGKAMAEDVEEKHQERMEHLRQEAADIKGTLAKKVDGLKEAVKKRVKGPRRPDRH